MKKKTANQLELKLKELRGQCLNEPTVFYKVGERVQRGCIKKSIITEIFDNGKMYKLHETYIDNNYGNPTEHERDDYVLWHDIEPYQSTEEIDQIQRFQKNDDSFINFSNRHVAAIYSTYYHFGIEMNPDYQRGNVWSLEQKQELINSMFENIDIGKFSFVNRPATERKMYEILDGKQRITALIEFKECRFKYKGKTYHQLHPRDRNHLDNYSISWGEMSSLKGGFVSDKEKYKYFLKLNTGGKLIDQEHIKKVKQLYENSK